MPAIAKVEPLTTRAPRLRGPVRLPPAPPPLAGVEVGSLLVVPLRPAGGYWAWSVDLASESAIAPERSLAAPLQRGSSRGVPAEARAPRPTGSRTSTAPHRARALSLVLPPGEAGPRPRVGGSATALSAELPGRRRRRAGGRASGWGAPPARGAGGAARCPPGGPLATAELPGGHRDGPRRLAERGFVALESRARPRRPSPRRRRVGGAPPGPPLPTPAQSAALGPVEAAIAAGRAERAGSCMASPGRARPRSTSALRPRRWNAGGPRSWIGARDRPDQPQIVAPLQSPAFGETVAVLHSRLSDGGALRRVAASAGGRGTRVRSGPRVGRVRSGSRTSGSSWWMRSTTPPTSTRATPGTTRGGWPSVAPRRRAPCSWAGSADAASGELALAAATCGCPSGVDGRPLPPVEVVDMRDAGARPCIRTPGTRARTGAAREAAQGDRAPQPPGLVQLPLLPLVRARLGVPATAT